ncbi:hypothetical protein DITRI_Ditri09bG0140900 [Diplodiscus trichospermus]
MLRNKKANREGPEADTEISYDYKIPDSEIEWLQEWAIGRLKDGMNVKSTQDILEAEGISCQICVMGGVTVLLKFDSKERLESVLSSTLKTRFDVARIMVLVESKLNIPPLVTIKDSSNVYKIIVTMDAQNEWEVNVSEYNVKRDSRKGAVEAENCQYAGKNGAKPDRNEEIVSCREIEQPRMNWIIFPMAAGQRTLMKWDSRLSCQNWK